MYVVKYQMMAQRCPGQRSALDCFVLIAVPDSAETKNILAILSTLAKSLSEYGDHMDFFFAVQKTLKIKHSLRELKYSQMYAEIAIRHTFKMFLGCF